jgi:hypothetical protein
MFFSNKFLKKNCIQYNENYKIYSDYDFIARIFKCRAKFKYISIPLVIYDTGGISSQISWVKRRDKYLSVYRNFGIIFLILSMLSRVNLGIINAYRILCKKLK